jgi:hypothetical protein
MRMEAKPLIAARLAYVHKEVVCCQSLVTLHNCSLHLGSRRFFQPLQVQTSPDPSPRHDPPIIPRTRGTTPPMSSTPLGGLPFCLLSRSGTQKQRCHVLYSPIAL